MWFTKKLSRHSCLASCHVDLPITLYIDPSHQALGDGHWEQPWPQVGSDLWPLSGMISTTHEGERFHDTNWNFVDHFLLILMMMMMMMIYNAYVLIMACIAKTQLNLRR
jgi:hypothetical protein